MSHKLHGQKLDTTGEWVKTHEVPHGYLDPTCEDCRRKKISGLSGRHFLLTTGMSRPDFERLATSMPEGIVHEMEKLDALPLMERRLARVASGVEESLDQEDLEYAWYYRSRPWEPHYTELEPVGA